MDALEYLLRRLKETGTPTYSDTPGMGNVQPHQIIPSRFKEDPEYAEQQYALNQFFLNNPMSRQQRLSLEQLLLDKGLHQNRMFWAMRPDQQKLREQKYLKDETSLDKYRNWNYQGIFGGPGRRM